MRQIGSLPNSLVGSIYDNVISIPQDLYRDLVAVKETAEGLLTSSARAGMCKDEVVTTDSIFSGTLTECPN